MLLRLSVPAAGGLRTVALDLATKVAAFAATTAPDTASVAADLEGLLERVAPSGKEADIGVEFRSVNGELLIAARCEGQASELRYPLPE